MSSRSLIAVEQETLVRLAEGTGLEIEFTADRAYLTIGATTYVAELTEVAR